MDEEREREQSRKGNRRKGRRDGESSPFPDASVPSVLPLVLSSFLRASTRFLSLSDLPADIPVLPPRDRQPPRVGGRRPTGRRGAAGGAGGPGAG